MLLTVLLAASAVLPQANDFIVPAGQTVFYDTSQGPLLVDNLIIEDGGVLRVQGPRRFLTLARQSIRIDGLMDLSGFNARDVATLNTGHVPEPGGPGGPGGGRGGDSSTRTTGSTPAGGFGLDGPHAQRFGGRGGESGYSGLPLVDARRPGGGGGGALAASVPGGPAAEDGLDGNPAAFGALSGLSIPAGGQAGDPLFRDGDPTNDFWGVRLDPVTNQLVIGELLRPEGGRGGGGGGDAIPSPVFPNVPWSPASDEKGGPGGGGGGLGLLYSRIIRFGQNGRVIANGGRGARGENTNFLDHIGGSGGGGSGGYLVLQGITIDLTAASDQAVMALGGAGGDAHFQPGAGPISGGGHGGPGVIQLHTPGSGAGVLLPPGKTVEDLTTPTAHLLLLRFSH